jgi:L-threonylcarbamoyladenylate synthase
METLRLRVDPERLDAPEEQKALERAAAILRAGGLVALPTETVYGLGANALDAAAVEKIFAAKERPSWDPLIVHVDGREMAGTVAREVPAAARALMDAFWPGPLTLLLPRAEVIPDAVTAGRDLVGMRMPAHAVALELIRRAGVPIAAPSANRFGATSPTTAEHVLADLDGRIDAVLDAGPTAVGVESTVLDPNRSPMLIYRPGAITAAQIRKVGGPVEHYQELPLREGAEREALPSPGVGIRHYAPQARVVLVENCKGGDMAWGVYENAALFMKERVGVMLPEGLPGEHSMEESRNHLDFAEIFPWGRWSDPEELAKRLFAGLRYLDGLGCGAIVCPMPQGDGIAVAIRDRLRKAAAAE